MVSFFCMKYTLSNVNKLHLNANLARHERVSQVLESTNLSSLCCIFFFGLGGWGGIPHYLGDCSGFWGGVPGFGDVLCSGVPAITTCHSVAYKCIAF